MLPPKRYDRIKTGIRARIQREKQQKELDQRKRYLAESEAKWKRQMEGLRSLLAEKTE